jgi:hypothetical protein
MHTWRNAIKKKYIENILQHVKTLVVNMIMVLSQ